MRETFRHEVNLKSSVEDINLSLSETRGISNYLHSSTNSIYILCLLKLYICDILLIVSPICQQGQCLQSGWKVKSYHSMFGKKICTSQISEERDHAYCHILISENPICSSPITYVNYLLIIVAPSV